MSQSPFAAALELVTHVPGVRGAMIVSAQDGVVVAEALMDEMKGSAVAALAASLLREPVTPVMLLTTAAVVGCVVGARRFAR